MPSTETQEQRPQPEVVSTSKAEQRLNSQDGRPATNHSSSSRKSRTLPPNSRGKGASNGITSPRGAVTPKPSSLGNASHEIVTRNPPGSSSVKMDTGLTNTANEGGVQDGNHQLENTDHVLHTPNQDGENILEEDELFMTLSEEERNEWDSMMANRSSQLEENLTNHKTWSEDFTKRRMFAYCRMRKLISSYTDRSKFLSDLTSRIDKISTSFQEINFAKNSTKNQESDTSLVSPRKPKSSRSSPSSSFSNPSKSLGKTMPAVPENSPSSPTSSSPAAADKNYTAQQPTDVAAAPS